MSDANQRSDAGTAAALVRTADRHVDVDRVRRLVGFGLVGASGIVVDGGLVALWTAAGVHYLLANAAGYGTAVTWNFLLNYRYVWGRPEGSLLGMYRDYLAADVVLFWVRIGVVVGLVELVGVPDVDVLDVTVAGEVLASLAGIGVVAAATFWVAENHVFDEDGGAT